MDLYNDYRMHGNVHTASYFVAEDVKPSSATFGIMSDYRHSQRDFRKGVVMKYNPNKGVHGYCLNLRSYQQLLTLCRNTMHIASEPELTRIDFKVDCNADTEAAYHVWRKLGEWAIACFIAKKRVKPRNEGRTASIATGEHESTRAATDGFELVCYNKALQKESEGVGYRFEARHKPKDGSDEYKALCKLRDLMRQLPDHAQAAISMQNTKLMNLWQKSAPVNCYGRSANEFIRTHAHDVYTTDQLRRLYVGLGYTEKAAEKATKNFTARNKSVFLPVREADLISFCEMFANYIDDFITADPVKKAA